MNTPRFRKLFLALMVICLGGGGAVTRGQSEGSVGALVNLPTGSTAHKRTRPAPPRTPGHKPTTQPDNSEQVDAALSLGDEQRAANPPRYADAEKSYTLAAKLGPKDARPYVGLGNLYYDQKKYAEAEGAYRRAGQLNPADGIAYARLAFMYSEMFQGGQGKTLDEAIAWARRSVAAQPTNYYTQVALGWTTYLKGNYKEAETAYRRSIELSPQVAALHIELARVLNSERRYRDALTPLNKAIVLEPKNYTAHFFAGIVQQKLGQLDKAAGEYLKAIAINPKASESRSNIGLIYYMLSQTNRAREQWNAAIQLGSTYAPDRIGLLILDGKLNEARGQLQDYTQKNGDDEDGWLMLGDVLRALGDESGARAADIRAAQIAPEYVGLKRPTLPGASAKNPPKSFQLVGTWRSRVSEFGQQYEITVRFAPEGTATYLMKDAMGRTATMMGTWQYSDGLLYERFSNGASGKGSINWVDTDNFVLTIIDNGVPAYSGIKRYYHRL